MNLAKYIYFMFLSLSFGCKPTLPAPPVAPSGQNSVTGNLGSSEKNAGEMLGNISVHVTQQTTQDTDCNFIHDPSRTVINLSYQSPDKFNNVQSDTSTADGCEIFHVANGKSLVANGGGANWLLLEPNARGIANGGGGFVVFLKAGASFQPGGGGGHIIYYEPLAQIPQTLDVSDKLIKVSSITYTFN
jgi:hypothetical protein